MAQAKRRQYNRRQFLAQHPYCCYCGDLATTTDHCPPRSFFPNRIWPESFEFPCCKHCNDASRLDEQVVAVIVWTSLSDNRPEAHQREWERLLRGLHNNQPDIIDEWHALEGSAAKRAFREKFGIQGADLRVAGYGVIEIGPLTKAAIKRFCVKLAQALYYRHFNEILDGEVIVWHIDTYSWQTRGKSLNDILKFSPLIEVPMRAKRPLVDNFVYRFNESQDLGILSFLVRFNEQAIFQIFALRRDSAETIKERWQSRTDFERFSQRLVSVSPKGIRRS